MLCVINGVQTVCVRYFRVMGRHFVVAGGVVLCCLCMVTRSLRVMIGCVLVVVRCFR